MLQVHVNIPVHIYRNAGLSGIWSVRYRTEKKLAMPKQVRYWTKLTQSGIFVVQYWTEIWDAGISFLVVDADVDHILKVLSNEKKGVSKIVLTH
jgi:hypothetical protein